MQPRRSKSALYQQVRDILDGARARTARSINVEMTRTYWLIGQAIVEKEQDGKERANYGDELIESLSKRFSQIDLKVSASKTFGTCVSFIWHIPKNSTHCVEN